MSDTKYKRKGTKDVIIVKVVVECRIPKGNVNG